MSINLKKDISGLAPVVSAETMLQTIRKAGIIPFFENPIPGWSVEELTPHQFWFDSDETLGPWDWKIYCVQSGDIAYGKFLWGGKAAFATVEVFRELMNWRRSLKAYQPSAKQQRVLDYLADHGSMGMRELRQLLGVKKSVADAFMTRLQMQTRVITGDIARVYRGQDLHYNGWQVSTFCAPEALFDDDTPFPFAQAANRIKSSLTPAESRQYLEDVVRRAAPSLAEMPASTAARLLSRLLD